LDEATIRRFNFKVKFRYLTTNGNIIFYRKILSSLVDASIDTITEGALKGIHGLAPGDFKTIRDRFFFYEKGKVNHSMLLRIKNVKIFPLLK